MRRSRACSSTPRSTAGTRRRTRPGSMRRIRARNTCSWTIRPATWLAEPDEVRGRRRALRRGTAYRHAVDTVILAQEIIVDNAAYPTEKIAKNSHDFRPLGLGYANLGALLMSMGIPYDSDQGRSWAAALTAIMCGQAYLTSARIAGEATGPVRGLRDQRRAVPGRDPDASRRNPGYRQQAGARRAFIENAKAVLGRGADAGALSGLPQRADHGDRAHRHHRIHDGLRHHRHRARSGAGEVQEAGGRRRDQDRQQHGAERADQTGLHRRPGQRDRGSRGCDRHHRGRSGAERRSTCRCSIAASGRRTARGRFTTWAT